MSSSRRHLRTTATMVGIDSLGANRSNIRSTTSAVESSSAWAVAGPSAGESAGRTLVSMMTPGFESGLGG